MINTLDSKKKFFYEEISSLGVLARENTERISTSVNKIIADIETKGDETGDYMYETAEKQISRYMMGAVKSLEDLQKYLERQKGNL